MLWTKEPGRPQSTGSKRVRHSGATARTVTCTARRVENAHPLGPTNSTCRNTVPLRGAPAPNTGTKMFNAALFVTAKREREKPGTTSASTNTGMVNTLWNSHTTSSCCKEWTRSNLLIWLNLRNMQLTKKKKSSCERYVEYPLCTFYMQDQACCFQMCNKLCRSNTSGKWLLVRRKVDGTWERWL